MPIHIPVHIPIGAGHIPIHIPIAARHVAAVKGAVWKVATCTRCEERYAYILELDATGEVIDLAFMNGKKSAEQARSLAQGESRAEGSQRQSGVTD